MTVNYDEDLREIDPHDNRRSGDPVTQGLFHEFKEGNDRRHDEHALDIREVKQSVSQLYELDRSRSDRMTAFESIVTRKMNIGLIILVVMALKPKWLDIEVIVKWVVGIG